MLRKFAVIGVGICCVLLAADETRQKAQVSKTERIEFPSGGALRLANSIGSVTVEAWDEPYVELTTIKSTKAAYDAREREQAMRALDRVRIASELRGKEVIIRTDFPRYRTFPPNPLRGGVNFELEYRIKAPASARFICDHDVGEVNVDGMAGDIQVTLLQGEILLHLPEEGRYNIQAKSDLGAVNSDFPGQAKRRCWLIGHRFANEDSSATRRLNLKVGVGDIVILKTRIPKAPEPLVPAQKSDGL